MRARALKAKLMGETATYERLNRECEEASARSAASAASVANNSTSTSTAAAAATAVAPAAAIAITSRAHVLAERARVAARPETEREARRFARKGAGAQVAGDGTLKRRFADDDVDLQTLVARTRTEGVEDYDRRLAMRIARNAAYKAPVHAEDVDAEEVARHLERKGSAQRTQERERGRVIQQAGRFNRQLAQCWYCMGSEKVLKHLVISLGEHTYVALPSRGRITPGHCLIVPREHVVSCRCCTV
jgi:Protein similar to CwfJ C-terminus 1